MMKVDEIIGNLLLKHNCVIIPGFGGFVAKKNASKIDYKSGLMTPPSKSLLFNRQLINNDGLLISEFAQQNNISYEESISTIEKLISNWTLELSAGNRISIDRVGFLFYDQERNICFEQDRYFNLLLSSFGLGSVHFLTQEDVSIVQHKIELKETQEQHETIFEQSIPIVIDKIVTEKEEVLEVVKEENIFVKQNVYSNSKTSFWKYAAVACLLPIIFYSLWIPMKTDVLESKIISFQDFNPFHNKENADYSKKSIDSIAKLPQQSEFVSLEEQLESVETSESTYSYNLTEKTFVQVEIDKAESKVTQQQEPITKVEHTTNVAGSIYYIVGCFSEEANAKTLVNELNAKGFSAFVKDKANGLSRVSLGKVTSQSELNQLIEKANSLGLSGWVLK